MYIIPPHDGQHHMPDIPGQRSQSMQRMTKADFHPIGSTLLTACNLLISLARPPRAGALLNGWVCLQSLLWCKVAFPSGKVMLLYSFLVAVAPACMEVILYILKQKFIGICYKHQYSVTANITDRERQKQCLVGGSYGNVAAERSIHYRCRRSRAHAASGSPAGKVTKTTRAHLPLNGEVNVP